MISIYIDNNIKGCKILKNGTATSIMTISFVALVVVLASTTTIIITDIITPISVTVLAQQESESQSQQQQEQYVFVKKWGTSGEEEGQFARPHDLDFSPSEDKLYVVDRDNHRVQVFDKNGTFLFTWGSEGEDEGQFNVPYGVDVDKQGNVWIADRGNHRIQKFDAQGNFLMKFGSEGSEDLEPGSEIGKFDNPRHIAVDDALKYFYVADSKNNRIQKFDINGTFIKSFGTLGNASGQFSLPVTIVIDSNGDLYINERGNERIQKFDTEGNPILMWGSKGGGPNQFCHMEHLAIDKFNNIYATDPQSDPGCSLIPAVKKFDSKGNFITQWGSAGEEDGQFGDPEHLAVDSEGNVYVSDRDNNNIQVFKPVIGEGRGQ
jgi:DNA-binding beta-propeller fold protein YncE